MDFKDTLKKIGEYYTAELRRTLKADDNFATGDLDKSIYYEVSNDGLELRIKSSKIIRDDKGNEISALLSVSEGVKPSSKPPSGEMVDRIMTWMKARGMQPMVRKYKKNKNGTYSATGQFRARKGYSARRSAAFAVSRGILRKGYKGSDVINRSYKKLESAIDVDIMNAFKLNIDKELNSINITNK